MSYFTQVVSFSPLPFTCVGVLLSYENPFRVGSLFLCERAGGKIHFMAKAPHFAQKKFFFALSL